MKAKKIGAVFLSLVICSSLLTSHPSIEAEATGSIEAALNWAVDIANDDTHWYSQTNRHGPNYDCSSLVFYALKNAGFDVGNSAFRTQEMRGILSNIGFKWIPWSEIGDKSNLQRGDILLDESAHTEFYLGNGKNVAAQNSAEGIIVCPYWNNDGGVSWDGVLRYQAQPIGREMSESEAAGRTIPDGVYCIGSALGDTLFVDPAPGSDIPAPSTANVALWSYDAGTLPDVQDRFAFKYQNNGFYTISQCRSAEKGREMCLDIYNGEQYSGTNVWMYESNQSSAQQWSVRKTDTGYSIQSKRNGFFLDVQDGRAEAGSNLQVWEGNDTLSQRFQLISPKPPAPKLTITYHSNGGRTATDSAYYVADNDSLIYQNDSKKQYSTIWEMDQGSVNGLRNASSFGLQREHYSFVGWSLSKDGSSTIFDQDDTSLTTKNLCPDLSKDTTIKVYAIWKHISTIGDINEDNKIDHNDLELLKDWILSDKAVSLADPKAADVNEDGKIDVLDLTVLKSSLLYTDWTTEAPPEGAKGVITRKEYRTIGKQIIPSETPLDAPYVLEDTKTELSAYGPEQTSDVPLENTKLREVTPYQDYIDVFVGWRMVYYVHQRAQSPYPREYTPKTYTGNNARASYGEHNNAMYGIERIASDADLANAIHVAPGEFSSSCSYSGYNGSENETAYVFPEEGQYLWFNSGEKVFEKREVTKYKYRERTEKTVYTYSIMGEFSEWTSIEPDLSADDAVQTRTVYKWLK